MQDTRSMKENFKLTQAGRNQAKWTMFRKLLWVFLIGEGVLFTAMLWIWKMPIATLAVIAVAMIALFVKRTWNNEGISFRDWGLHLDEQSVYLTERPEGTEIKRGDVKEVVESKAGLIVKGQRFGQQIWIPAGVEDYVFVRQKLKSWSNGG